MAAEIAQQRIVGAYPHPLNHTMDHEYHNSTMSSHPMRTLEQYPLLTYGYPQLRKVC